MPTDATGPRYLTVDEVAELLRQDSATIYRKVKLGDDPRDSAHVRRPGGAAGEARRRRTGPPPRAGRHRARPATRRRSTCRRTRPVRRRLVSTSSARRRVAADVRMAGALAPRLVTRPRTPRSPPTRAGLRPARAGLL